MSQGNNSKEGEHSRQEDVQQRGSHTSPYQPRSLVMRLANICPKLHTPPSSPLQLLCELSRPLPEVYTIVQRRTNLKLEFM